MDTTVSPLFNFMQKTIISKSAILWFFSLLQSKTDHTRLDFQTKNLKKHGGPNEVNNYDLCRDAKKVKLFPFSQFYIESLPQTVPSMTAIIPLCSCGFLWSLFAEIVISLPPLHPPCLIYIHRPHTGSFLSRSRFKVLIRTWEKLQESFALQSTVGKFGGVKWFHFGWLI